MYFEEYEMLKKIRYRFKIIYKKKYLKYFYNFKNVIDNLNYKLKLKVNLIDINIFKNTELYFEENFIHIFPFIKKEEIKFNHLIQINKI
jgi:hypothetical protein